MSDETFQFDQCEVFAAPPWLDRVLRWCQAQREILLIAAGAFQLALLTAMVVINAAPLVVGDTILLKVEPLDPRDLFRGDYVILTYVINRVSPQGIEGIAGSAEPSSYLYGAREPEERVVYVGLEPDADGKYWHGTRMSLERPASGKFIRGVYRGYRWGPGRLSYGIETFYVPEGTGHKYEDAARKRQLAAEIALPPWGQAKLRGLRIE
jgi:uncharacterized membrane-anchored protein